MSSPQNTIDNCILVCSKNISDNISTFSTSERGCLSQNILSQLRNLVEHIMLKEYEKANPDGMIVNDDYECICRAIKYVKTRGELNFLNKLHNLLKISSSHYTINEDGSVRLMLKYYEYLLRIKKHLQQKYSLTILENLDRFPLEQDTTLVDYYKAIALKLDEDDGYSLSSGRQESYYIHKVKPFFVNEKIYYEVTFIPINEKSSKFDRFIAFTVYDLPQYYAVSLSVYSESISILSQSMPVFIIASWKTWIRPCEIIKYSSILGITVKISRRNPEYKKLMLYLTESGLSLLDIIKFPETDFSFFCEKVFSSSDSTNFYTALVESRTIIQNNRPGYNVLSYLLYHLNNRIIKNQKDKQNQYLSNLNLSFGCIPFDEMPYTTSLINHNPKLCDLFDCINMSGRTHELFARFIKNKADIEGCVFNRITNIKEFQSIDELAKTYNQNLYYKHQNRKLIIDNGYVYIDEYKNDTLYLLKELSIKANESVTNYSNSVKAWLSNNHHIIDCDEKKHALIHMFEKSRLSLIYGSAGTGKSTLIDHISQFFNDKQKLYLANTNPAVDNLKRRITASNTNFMTIEKYTRSSRIAKDYDIIFIDECSTVSNRHMKEVLEQSSFRLLVLVGDIYQIESIRFGNWFSIAKDYIPEDSITELTHPYRSTSKVLISLWDRVRKMDDAISELLARHSISSELDSSIFSRTNFDEVILCLNYDGLYGINNLNRYLQQSNHNDSIFWGLQCYKVNDPVLFNECDRFSPLIYNNMKGRIVKIEQLDNSIQFDIELDRVLNEIDADRYDDLEIIDSGLTDHSVIRFSVDKYDRDDEDDDVSSTTVIPFQIAYAVSIHKAQGLEFNSVKIIISDEVDELITHNIFYTAITRARENLKIYWSPEVEKKVLAIIKPKQCNHDIAIFRGLANLH